MAVDHTCQASAQNPSFEIDVFDAVLLLFYWVFHLIPAFTP